MPFVSQVRDILVQYNQYKALCQISKDHATITALQVFLKEKKQQEEQGDVLSVLLCFLENFSFEGSDHGAEIFYKSIIELLTTSQQYIPFCAALHMLHNEKLLNIQALTALRKSKNPLDILMQAIRPKLLQIVQAETIHYMAQFASPKTEREFVTFTMLAQQIQTLGVAVVWDHIKDAVFKKMMPLTDKKVCDNIRLVLIDIVSRGKSFTVGLKNFHEQVQQSSGYHEYERQKLREVLRYPAASDFFKLGTDTNSALHKMGSSLKCRP